MIITVLSQEEAVTYYPIKENAVILRIFDQNGDIPELQYRNLFQEVKEMFFYDIQYEETASKEALSVHSFQEEHAHEVLEFFLRNREKEEMIIHCQAGVSRSAAIGIMLTRFLNRPDLEKAMYNSRRFVPNELMIKRIGKVMTEEGYLQKEKSLETEWKKVKDYLGILGELTPYTTLKEDIESTLFFMKIYEREHPHFPVTIFKSMYNYILSRLDSLKRPDIESWIEGKKEKDISTDKEERFYRGLLDMFEEVAFQRK